jgi:PRTRC genetic system protein E
MFVAIEPLLRACAKLTLSMQMKGDEMVVCVMPQGTAKDAAMLQPLALTATPAELDAGFVQALVAYTGAHASLAEQVAATTAILDAAKGQQVSKATKTLAKGNGKTAIGSGDRASTDSADDDDGEEGDKGQGTASNDPAASASVSASPEPASSGTNLASLFD